MSAADLPRLASHDTAPRTRLRAAVAVGVLLATLASVASVRLASAGDPAKASTAPTAALRAAPAWSSEIQSIARTIPVQEGGRVMPLDTFAQFTLLRLNHRRQCESADGRSLSPIEWLLEVLVRPERARRIACFAVDSSEVLDSVGLAHEGKKKRDRYAYADLEAGAERMERLAVGLHKKESKERSAVEEEIVALSQNLSTFGALLHALDFAREELAVDGSPRIAELFEGKKSASVLEIVGRSSELRALVGTVDPHAGGGHASESGPDAKAAGALREEILTLADSAGILPIIPPAGGRTDGETWFTAGHIVYALSEGGSPAPEQVAAVRALAAMAAATDDLPTFQREIGRLRDATSTLAKRRGEYDKIELEVFLSRLDPFYRSLYLYIFAFLALAVTWMRPSRWLTRGAWALILSALALQVAGIVIRCVLRERPPIKSLYEVTLFVAALGPVVFLVAEKMSRRGIALALAPVMGGLTQFVANRFEVMKGEDTMPQLVAVLDTNFWLALHVTCITIGYSGGLVAALLANAHVLGRAVGFKRGNADGYRALGKMTYGMLCFALLFSVVGTILGGIWANDAWGRFWGWDPKENGALLICLAQLAILHARMGGYLKPFGVAMATIGQGAVVAASWWGVNLLQIGLHSYGFSGGIFNGLMTFWLAEAGVLAAGLATYLFGRA